MIEEEKIAETPTVAKQMQKSTVNAPATTTGEIMPSLSVYDKLNDPTTALEKMGTWFTRSGMYGCEKVEQGIVLALHCVSQKKDPLELLRTHHLIQGRLSMRADAMLAAYRERGGKVKWVTFDDTTAEADFVFEGETTRIAYTLDEAKKAGLVRPNSPWIKQPSSMLRARLISKAVRMLCPEVNSGLYSPEEVRDFKPQREEQESEPLFKAGDELPELKPVQTELVEAPKP